MNQSDFGSGQYLNETPLRTPGYCHECLYLLSHCIMAFVIFLIQKLRVPRHGMMISNAAIVLHSFESYDGEKWGRDIANKQITLRRKKLNINKVF